MNKEGYRDETAEKAIHNAAIKKTPDSVMQVINMMKAIASVAGLEVIGRIKLKDKETGKKYE